ncbi:hypothetical protein CCUS01_08380 [Colletotrichum cuscutae]|uniref:Uncharacterized protein n=1 Tax=Colletotrichum cuscutae TaxID=1209917 RepID=A0AAI9US42_9PEZI|nr:hypothetical protein CCUS01_08380 [Colletotrichum cuscutae]
MVNKSKLPPFDKKKRVETVEREKGKSLMLLYGLGKAEHVVAALVITGHPWVGLTSEMHLKRDSPGPRAPEIPSLLFMPAHGLALAGNAVPSLDCLVAFGWTAWGVGYVVSWLSLCPLWRWPHAHTHLSDDKTLIGDTTPAGGDALLNSEPSSCRNSDIEHRLGESGSQINQRQTILHSLASLRPHLGRPALIATGERLERDLQIEKHREAACAYQGQWQAEAQDSEGLRLKSSESQDAKHDSPGAQHVSPNFRRRAISVDWQNCGRDLELGFGEDDVWGGNRKRECRWMGLVNCRKNLREKKCLPRSCLLRDPHDSHLAGGLWVAQLSNAPPLAKSYGSLLPRSIDSLRYVGTYLPN